MLMVGLRDTQTPFLVVHCKIVVPVVNPVMPLLPEVNEVIVPLPDIRVQEPVPTEGLLPVKAVNGVVTHTLWLPATLAVVGAWSVCIVNVETLEQAPLLSFHSKVVLPGSRPVMVVVALFIADTVPGPDTTDQVPMPIVGEFAVMVAMPGLAHTVWPDPATEMPGKAKVITLIVATLGAQPGVYVVHDNTVVPVVRPVNVLL